ncbi:cyclophilin-like domain-containing protein [Lipomyces japonicus]|uniref:cyclophilin-like domain-containing protein n=1 Tax=Lipomyces japonicus TaxID=56871 RepID=UPI0034CF2BFC
MPPLPRVFLDIASPAVNGRLIFELFVNDVPITCDNFKALCTGINKNSLSYRGTIFHRIVAAPDPFIVQGGDIVNNDGTSGLSIFGDSFDDENLAWRNVDQEGLLVMANQGPDSNSSQFFISLTAAPHLDGRCVVFGSLVAGRDVLKSFANVPVNEDDDDRPLKGQEPTITNSGELIFKKKERTKPSVSASIISTTTTTDFDAKNKLDIKTRQSLSGSPIKYETNANESKKSRHPLSRTISSLRKTSSPPDRCQPSPSAASKEHDRDLSLPSRRDSDRNNSGQRYDNRSRDKRHYNFNEGRLRSNTSSWHNDSRSRTSRDRDRDRDRDRNRDRDLDRDRGRSKSPQPKPIKYKGRGNMVYQE